jgi:hypothetical protein
MNVEQLSPWISLLAAILSICYLAVDYARTTPKTAAEGETDASESTVVNFITEHDGFLISTTVLLFIAGVIHWFLRSTAFFYPVLIWATTGLLVVVLVVGEVSGAAPDVEP